MNSYRSLDDAMIGVVDDIMRHGVDTSPRGMGTREITSLAFMIEDPRDRICTVRDVRLGYCAASLAYNLDERNDVDSICWWNPNGRRISDDGVTFYGANYGQRWSGYLDEAMELLKLDSDTRRAWIPIYQPWDMVDVDVETGEKDTYSRTGKDVPCTIGFGLRILANQLCMQVVMRSQNVVGVMPYDVFLFTALQELIANEMSLELGWYEHFMMSAHVYERDFETTDKITAYGVDGPYRLDGPMKPIELTLSTAKKAYGGIECAVRRGDIASSYQIKKGDRWIDSDPIVDLMIEHRPRS